MPEHDVVVIGGGVAGLRAALAAQRAGVNVAVVSKLHPVRSHSAGTRAGINAALGAEDAWEQHAADTIRASDYLADQDVVEILCREALTEIVTLAHLGRCSTVARIGVHSYDSSPGRADPGAALSTI